MQDQVFAEIDRIRRERGTALILITHDISLVVGELRPGRHHVCRADRGDGAGARRSSIGPMHPYTIGLQNASADLGDRGT